MRIILIAQDRFRSQSAHGGKVAYVASVGFISTSILFVGETIKRKCEKIEGSLIVGEGVLSRGLYTQGDVFRLDPRLCLKLYNLRA